MTHILQKHFPNDATCTIERLGPINWRRTEPANCCSKKKMVPLYHAWQSPVDCAVGVVCTRVVIWYGQKNRSKNTCKKGN